MANNLKIIISADASEASQELKKLQSDTDNYTTKSLSQLKTALKEIEYSYMNGNASSEEYEKAQKQLANTFGRVTSSILSVEDDTKRYNKAIIASADMLKYLNTYTRNADFSKVFEEAKADAETYNAELQKTIESQKKLAEEQAKSTVELLKQKETNTKKEVDSFKATALGDTSYFNKEEYSAMEKQLTELAKAEVSLKEKSAELIDQLTKLNQTANQAEYDKLQNELQNVRLEETKTTNEASRLGKQMNELQAKMDATAKINLGTRMKNLITSFVSAQAVIFLVQKSIQLVKKAFTEMAEAASHAEETANLFNTTFGNIQISANNVASNLSSSLGLATSSAQEILGLFGDLAMGYGQSQSAALEFAESAVKTGLDIISFKNITGDTTEILQAMASGLAGNFENFRKWGIIVTQAEIKTRLQQKGLDKLTDSSLQYAKVQETLAIVQEKSKNAFGDMEKTLESTENINRRMHEANKELMENLGSSINKILNPLKSKWIDIATAINKAQKAQAEYAKGSRNINIFDIANNKEDRESFDKALLQAEQDATLIENKNPFDIGPAFMKDFDVAQRDLISSFKKIMILYNASAEEIEQSLKDQKLYNKKTSSLYYGVIKELSNYEKEIAEYNRWELKKAERANSLEDSSSSAQSFIDALNSIKGVSTNADAAYYGKADYASTEGIYDWASTQIEKQLQLGIQEAISSIDATDWEEFVDPFSLALGDATEIEGLNEKLTELKTLYEQVYNQHLKDGELTEEEKEDLSDIARIYATIKDEIEDITDKQSFLSILDSLSAQASSYDTQIAKLGKTDKEQAFLDIESQRASQIAEANGDVARIELLNESFDKIVKKMNEYYDALDKLNEETERASNADNAISDITSLGTSIGDNTARIGLSGKDLEIFNLESYRKAAIAIGLTAEEQAKLNKEYQIAKENIERYYSILEADDIYNEIISITSDYEEQLSTLGKTEEEIAYMNLESLKKRIDALGVEDENYNKLLAEYNKAARLIPELAEAQRKLNGENEKASWQTKINTFGMSDKELALYDLGQMDVDNKDGIASLINQFYELQEQAELSSLAIGSLGELGDIFTALGSGAGGIVTMLIELISETEAFQELSSILTDYVLPVLNAFLEPLLPVIEMIGLQLQMLTEIVLEPLFPLLKMIAKIAVIAWGTVNVAFGFIRDIIKVVCGNIQLFVLNLYNGIVKTLKKINIFGWKPFGWMKTADTSQAEEWANTDIMGNMNDNIAKMQSSLESIDKMTMSINKNTSDNDDISAQLDILNEFKSKGIINDYEYDAQLRELLGSPTYGRTAMLSSDSYYRNGANGTTNVYRNGNTTIEINGVNLSQDEIVKLVERALLNQEIAGKKTYA